MKELERQYRSSIRWYSPGWRRAHAEALLDTLLEGAEAENRSRPTAREKRDLAMTGLRQRVISVVPYVLFAVALASGLVLATALQAGFQATLVLTVQALGYPVFSAFVAGITGAVLCVASGSSGVLLLRRNRRAIERESLPVDSYRE